MADISSVSVTTTPCSCSYLQRAAQDPNMPVKFDPAVNEFFIESTLSGGTKVALWVYHCPMCGGVASKSTRKDLFKTLSNEEVLRLDTKLSGLTNVQEVLAVLGPPDEDLVDRPPSDAVVLRPLSGERETGLIRQLRYSRLSETADVYFRIFTNGEVQSSIGPKYIGRMPK